MVRFIPTRIKGKQIMNQQQLEEAILDAAIHLDDEEVVPEKGTKEYDDYFLRHCGSEPCEFCGNGSKYPGIGIVTVHKAMALDRLRTAVNNFKKYIISIQPR